MLRMGFPGWGLGETADVRFWVLVGAMGQEGGCNGESFMPWILLRA